MAAAADVYPEGTFQICPQFIEFNNRSCHDLSDRYKKHNSQRSKCIMKCANEVILEVHNMSSSLSSSSFSKVPQFDEKEDILANSIHEMDAEINRTKQTVFAHKCKTPIITYQQFSKKANNRQDQNSWKISGKYLYSPYIYSFLNFIKQETLFLNQSSKYIGFTLLLFASKILKSKVKFERAKEKHLIRDRTLVLSSSLHEAFKTLHPYLDIHKFYIIEKEKRKKIQKKVISSEFHKNISQFCDYLLFMERQKLTNDYKQINIENNYHFPKEWISNNNDDDDDDDKDDDDDDMDDDEEDDNNTLNTVSITYDDDEDDEDDFNNNMLIPSFILNGNISDKLQVSSPKSLTFVGSDTIMNGTVDIHTNEMGYSFN